MRRLLLVGFVFLLTVAGKAADARIHKVLPVFLDERGRKSLSPSLYERDAYQAELRGNPRRVSGLRFDVNWKARGYRASSLRLRVEMRTADRPAEGAPLQIEAPVSGRGTRRRWTAVRLDGDAYRSAGEVIAWRVVLLDGDRPIAEQRSFLW